MLHALGITHVVSVGECALVPPACLPHSTPPLEPGTHLCLGSNEKSNVDSQLILGPGPNGQGSLWIEEREGRIKVLDIKVFGLLLMDRQIVAYASHQGVSDDGIDSLRPQFAPISDWIEKARLDGGKVYGILFRPSWIQLS